MPVRLSKLYSCGNKKPIVESQVWTAQGTHRRKNYGRL